MNKDTTQSLGPGQANDFALGRVIEEECSREPPPRQGLTTFAPPWTKTGTMRWALLRRRPNPAKNERSDVLAYSSTGIAVLASGEIRAKRQLCRTLGGGRVKMRPDEGRGVFFEISV
jgi:hypothetical protein